MPVPDPKGGETQDDFIGRCASWAADEHSEMPEDQRLAMCYNAWRESKAEMSVEDVLSSIQIVQRWANMRAVAKRTGGLVRALKGYGPFLETASKALEAAGHAEAAKAAADFKAAVDRIENPAEDKLDGLRAEDDEQPE